jgi:phasin family protein
MADNEDQKDKALPGISAKPVVKPAVPVPPKVSASPASKARPVAVKSKPVVAAPVAAKPVEAKIAAPAPKPVEAAIPAVPPVAPKAPEPAVTPPVVPEKAAVAPVVVKAPELPPKIAAVASAAKVAVAKPVAAKPAIKAAVAKPAKVQVKPKPAPVPKAPVAAAKPKPVEPVVPVKAAVAKPVIAIAKDETKAAAPVVSPKAVEPKAAPKTAPQDTPVFAGLFTNFLLEEKTMTSANFAGFQDAITEAQAKAKAAFEKSTSALGEVSDFAKGNVEAVVESGKIFAEGVQGLGSELVAEGRSAFEAMTGDIKELAAAKSPTDFFKLQSDLVRKNFDTAVANGSKNSEALLKLFSDTFAPISGRVSIAVEKARSAAVPSAY